MVDKSWDGRERRKRRECWDGKVEQRKVQTEKKHNGIVVTSKLIGTITAVIVLAGMIANLYSSRVLADNEIKVHTEKIASLGNTDQKIVDLIQLVQTNAAIQETKLDNTRTDVAEMKQDIKSIAKAVKA
jgi:hypothetical protein